VLEFAALAPAEAHLVRYRYRLQGVDDAWVAAEANRQVRYPALAPGRYVFEVRATMDGVVESALQQSVIVAAPWWHARWLQISAVVALLLATAAAVRTAATRRLRARIQQLEVNRRIQLERERISADLHDHVGGQLATLMSGIELAQLSAAGGRHDQATTHLQSLAADARRTLSHLREAVWSLDSADLSARGLVDYIEEAAQAQRRYRDRPIVVVRGDIARDRTLSPAEAMHLLRIAQEALANALKHANASRVQVDLAVREDGRLSLVVRDDGQHRKPALTGDGSGFGVRGMESRARQLGAEFVWGPAADGGTLVSVLTPPPDRR
jgi:signal transduction histidine kinase